MMSVTMPSRHQESNGDSYHRRICNFGLEIQIVATILKDANFIPTFLNTTHFETYNIVSRKYAG